MSPRSQNGGRRRGGKTLQLFSRLALLAMRVKRPVRFSTLPVITDAARSYDTCMAIFVWRLTRGSLLSSFQSIFLPPSWYPKVSLIFIRVQESAPCDYGQRSDERQSRRSLGAAGARAVEDPFVRQKGLEEWIWTSIGADICGCSAVSCDQLRRAAKSWVRVWLEDM